jgi:predicted SnoaL-like aldol condensation-catalyzing enzyme
MTTFTSETSITEENKALVRRTFDEIGKGNLDIIDEVVSEDYRQHSILGVPPGREGVKRFFREFGTAFPDVSIKILDMAAEGDRVFMRARMSGTWKREYLGQKPTGKRFDVVEFDEFRIYEGKLVEHWDALDTGTFARQLGFKPQTD